MKAFFMTLCNEEDLHAVLEGELEYKHEEQVVVESSMKCFGTKTSKTLLSARWKTVSYTLEL